MSEACGSDKLILNKVGHMIFRNTGSRLTTPTATLSPRFIQCLLEEPTPTRRHVSGISATEFPFSQEGITFRLKGHKYEPHEQTGIIQILESTSNPGDYKREIAYAKSKSKTSKNKATDSGLSHEIMKIVLGLHNKIFNLSTESRYLVAVDVFDCGHPYDNARELFASLSAILIYFPTQFMDRVSELTLSNQLTPNNVDVILQTARHVVSLYFKQHPKTAREIFSRELLEYLDFEQEQTAQK